MDSAPYSAREARIVQFRGFPYYGHQIALIKDIKIRREGDDSVRGEFFNVWNWHIRLRRHVGDRKAFDEDVSSPHFGKWTGP